MYVQYIMKLVVMAALHFYTNHILIITFFQHNLLLFKKFSVGLAVLINVGNGNVLAVLINAGASLMHAISFHLFDSIYLISTMFSRFLEWNGFYI